MGKLHIRNAPPQSGAARQTKHNYTLDAIPPRGSMSNFAIAASFTTQTCDAATTATSGRQPRRSTASWDGSGRATPQCLDLPHPALPLLRHLLLPELRLKLLRLRHLRLLALRPKWSSAPPARAAGHRAASPPPMPSGMAAGGPSLEKIIREAFDKGYSDIHVGVGEVPRYRNRGEITATDYPVTTHAMFDSWLTEILDA